MFVENMVPKPRRIRPKDRQLFQLVASSFCLRFKRKRNGFITWQNSDDSYIPIWESRDLTQEIPLIFPFVDSTISQYVFLTVEVDDSAARMLSKDNSRKSRGWRFLQTSKDKRSQSQSEKKHVICNRVRARLFVTVCRSTYWIVNKVT